MCRATPIQVENVLQKQVFGPKRRVCRAYASWVGWYWNRAMESPACCSNANSLSFFFSGRNPVNTLIRTPRNNAVTFMPSVVICAPASSKLKPFVGRQKRLIHRGYSFPPGGGFGTSESKMATVFPLWPTKESSKSPDLSNSARNSPNWLV